MSWCDRDLAVDATIVLTADSQRIERMSNKVWNDDPPQMILSGRARGNTYSELDIATLDYLIFRSVKANVEVKMKALVVVLHKCNQDEDLDWIKTNDEIRKEVMDKMYVEIGKKPPIQAVSRQANNEDREDF